MKALVFASALLMSSSALAQNFTCHTNQGSSLIVNTSNRQAKLTTSEGTSKTYTIVDIQYGQLESLPPWDEYRIKLNDGRGLIIRFHDKNREGQGVWLRLGGGSSPEFQCWR